MREDVGAAPMADPLAYFLTWATYGTWLPGDERGWIAYHKGWQLPNAEKKAASIAKMTEEACLLDAEQRSVVEAQVAETCRHKCWTLLAVNCRSTHLHVVVNAPVKPEIVRDQLKAWCTRRLKELERKRRPEKPGAPDDGMVREKWWAEKGSARYINRENDLEAAVVYVRECQD